jgi:hypothetical protein
MLLHQQKQGVHFMPSFIQERKDVKIYIYMNILILEKLKIEG